MLPLTSKDKLNPISTNIIGIDFTHRQSLYFVSFFLPKWAQFCALSFGVFVFYVANGYIQELMFRLDGMKPFGLYLTFVQFIVYSLFAFTEGKLRGGMKRRIPMKTYIQLAFYTVATMGLTNASVGYLNYPTHLIFKCCKLIPVLIGGIIIQGKKYGWLDLLAASLMSFGLIIFTLADSKVAPNFDPRGYVMICLALLADAIIGNVQEKVMHTYGATNNEVIFYSYTIGSIYIFSGLLITGQFTDAFIFFLQNSWRTYGYAILFGTLGYLGVNMVLSLIRTSGALLTVTVTTVRKAITIILSFLLFAKPFTITYLWGGLIVLFSIYLNLYNKNRSKWNPILFQWISYVTGADQIMSSRYKSSELM
ncbi:Adenosine 3'-phospho 5'-phosphosulfate transporter 2 [Toxocara canis]|uniref:Adenosine 3'-phospho 5'-phosphosulfate transporter 2 n=1 Tax=Toxocara canis TaxID=6265 RepID=A0A0B2VDX5_TOXCA|nr:Adenosine 3'-phospho 5'-phosphosulfate transporter 2 [Toxocara canis]